MTTLAKNVTLQGDYRWLDALPSKNGTPTSDQVDQVALFSIAPLSLLATATQYGVNEFLLDVAAFSIFWLCLIVGAIWMWHVLSTPKRLYSTVGVKQYHSTVEAPQQAPQPATPSAVEWITSASGARVPIRRK